MRPHYVTQPDARQRQKFSANAPPPGVGMRAAASLPRGVVWYGLRLDTSSVYSQVPYLTSKVALNEVERFRGVGSGVGDPGAGDPPALLHGDEEAQPRGIPAPAAQLVAAVCAPLAFAPSSSKCTRRDGNIRSLRKSLVGIGPPEPQFEPIVAPVEDIMQRLARMAAAYGIVEQPADTTSEKPVGRTSRTKRFPPYQMGNTHYDNGK
ncbi:hypothetical protein BJ912DRAFT_931385 [Pholiota molesta]|nr:hypothetical protein BJ912DRAFT_931385 [Pholiota molesta]